MSHTLWATVALIAAGTIALPLLLGIGRRSRKSPAHITQNITAPASSAAPAAPSTTTDHLTARAAAERQHPGSGSVAAPVSTPTRASIRHQSREKRGSYRSQPTHQAGNDR